MNGRPETVKDKFFAALKGRSFNCKGIVSSHDEDLTEQGLQQVWDALKIADLEVKVKE